MQVIFQWQMMGVKTMSRAKRTINNNKGMAMIEALPLLIIFVMLVSFGLGFYGIVHTSTLHSIAARTYAFETFRGRTNLNYFREDGSGLDRPLYMGKRGFRYHAIQNEYGGPDQFVATERTLSIGRNLASTENSSDTHNQKIYDLAARNEKISVNPVWVMVGYGICLNASCGN